MDCKRIAICLCFASLWILGSLSASAQYGINHTITWQDFSEQTQCTTNSCWWRLPGTLTQIDCSANGDCWGVNSSGNIYEWDSTTRNWTSKTGFATNISVGNDAATVHVVGSNGNTFYWNGSGWTQFGTKAMLKTCVGGDDDMWGIATDNTVWHWSGSAWVSEPGTAQDIACESNREIYAVGSGAAHEVVYWNGSGWTQVPGTLGGTASTVGTSDHGIFVTLTNNNIKFNDLISSGYITINGGLTDIKGHGTNIVGVYAPGTNNVWHLNWLGANFSGNLSGSYTTFCNNHPNTCQNSFTHTITYQPQFVNGLDGAKAQSQGNPFSNLNASSFDVTNPIDCNPFFGDPNSSACQPAETTSAQCSSMGVLLTDGGQEPSPARVTENATTYMTRDSGPCDTTHEYTAPNGRTYCAWPVHFKCSNTSNPDLNPDATTGNVPAYIWDDAQISGVAEWKVTTPCTSWEDPITGKVGQVWNCRIPPCMVKGDCAGGGYRNYPVQQELTNDAGGACTHNANDTTMLTPPRLPFLDSPEELAKLIIKP